jgi:hypothetical protein
VFQFLEEELDDADSEADHGVRCRRRFRFGNVQQLFWSSGRIGENSYNEAVASTPLSRVRRTLGRIAFLDRRGIAETRDESVWMFDALQLLVVRHADRDSEGYRECAIGPVLSDQNPPNSLH